MTLLKTRLRSMLLAMALIWKPSASKPMIKRVKSKRVILRSTAKSLKRRIPIWLATEMKMILYLHPLRAKVTWLFRRPLREFVELKPTNFGFPKIKRSIIAIKTILKMILLSIVRRLVQIFSLYHSCNTRRMKYTFNHNPGSWIYPAWKRIQIVWISYLRFQGFTMSTIRINLRHSTNPSQLYGCLHRLVIKLVKAGISANLQSSNDHSWSRVIMLERLK